MSAAKEEQRESAPKSINPDPDAVEELEEEQWREAKKHYSLSPLPGDTNGSSSSSSATRISHVPPFIGKQKIFQDVGQRGHEWYSIDPQDHGTHNTCIGNTSCSSSRIGFGFDDSYGGVLGAGGAVADGTKISTPAGSCRSDTAGGTGEGNQKRESVRYVAESFIGTVIDGCCTPRVD